MKRRRAARNTRFKFCPSTDSIGRSHALCHRPALAAGQRHGLFCATLTECPPAPRRSGIAVGSLQPHAGGSEDDVDGLVEIFENEASADGDDGDGKTGGQESAHGGRSGISDGYSNMAPSTGPDQAIKCDPGRERSAARIARLFSLCSINPDCLHAIDVVRRYRTLSL